MTISHPTTPLVAILRGLQPAEAVDVAKVLYNAGFRALEVPLNRPGALECIAAIVKLNLPDTLVGGGTMLSVAHVEAVYEAGGRLLVSPNCNPAAIRRAAELGMYCAPGVATPTEAFAALDAGAHALKLFPAEMVGHGGLKAMLSVVPAGTPMWPVGGVTPETMAGWKKAGATGFGIGGALFTPGVSLEELGERAAAFVNAWRALAA
ncbi:MULTISPECIES: 2-dehydro-3-deoxy-6-phosphogalactonate aldolase [Duganella]|uniref:2-dehydro-3-deoxy-6-phosphogalactonate aldolase n=1 Tax=Duganella phyllosphaerae TaxID=762836 RepID=A0A1E7WHW7_9BURK|nr:MULTISPECIES: 2-dehydro-3-deoxy-6-phosphogalactonate aldolase [Duganella]KQN75622.1 2-dehydro-3-deoxy-6-phosphogalactonate aldolase [Duganella sp. Leaf61]MDR7051713.1 2-dehydro-3-deoxyphosphogalactonate aldolase [Duganella sp. 3397]MPQ57113.1 2-dehydro-3-deoxy-6-phosphogalactonate aldolase [Duganella sp. FT27W]OEZ98084.1 2-dehydro-3-deoxy-6-phosphogalactonate aldolase [Duganella phyllosphaerae]